MHNFILFNFEWRPPIKSPNFHEYLVLNKKFILKSDRNFGLTMTIALALIGLISFRQRSLYCYLFWTSSSIFFILSILSPKRLHLVHIKWMQFGAIIKQVTTPLILTLFFFIFLTPLALVLKVLGKDLLGLRMKKDYESYWVAAEEPSSFKDQF